MDQPRSEHTEPPVSPQAIALQAAVADWLDAHHEELIEMRRFLHAHPEPSREEYATTQWIKAQLVPAGAKIRLGEDNRGLIVDFEIGNPPSSAPIFALRADIDGLRLDDLKFCEYKSTNPGITHACGHDAHTTIALTVLRLCRAIHDNAELAAAFPARLRFLFQPAEEVCEGAASLVRQGAMDGVAAILGLHVDPLLKAGQVGIRYGALTAHCDELQIEIRGTGGHAARPHHTTDPIAAAAMLITTLYQQLPRVSDVLDPSVLTFGKIHGGTVCNVIPESVKLIATLRTTESEVREKLKHQSLTICRHIGEMTGNTVDAKFGSPLGSVRNDHAITRVVQSTAETAFGRDSIVSITRPSLGGEDFSAYLDHAPGCQVRVGCARPDADDWPLLHSPHFDIDESCLRVGAELLTLALLNVVQG